MAPKLLPPELLYETVFFLPFKYKVPNAFASCRMLHDFLLPRAIKWAEILKINMEQLKYENEKLKKEMAAMAAKNKYEYEKLAAKNKEMAAEIDSLRANEQIDDNEQDEEEEDELKRFRGRDDKIYYNIGGSRPDSREQLDPSELKSSEQRKKTELNEMDSSQSSEQRKKTELNERDKFKETDSSPSRTQTDYRFSDQIMERLGCWACDLSLSPRIDHSFPCRRMGRRIAEE